MSARNTLAYLDARLTRADEIEAAARAFVKTMGVSWISPYPTEPHLAFTGFTSASGDAARALAEVLGMEPEQ